MSIKHMPSDERPREKAMIGGIKTLSNYELIALILESGNKQNDVLEISRNLINNSNGLLGLSKQIYSSLIKIDGISKAKALKLLATFELHDRLVNVTCFNNYKLIDLKDFYQKYKAILYSISIEKLWVFILNARRQVISYFEMDNNDITIQALPIEIVKKVLNFETRFFFISHNHLSNDVEPSIEDLKFNEKLLHLSKDYNLIMIDHLIIGQNTYFSFKINNLI